MGHTVLADQEAEMPSEWMLDTTQEECTLTKLLLLPIWILKQQQLQYSYRNINAASFRHS